MTYISLISTLPPAGGSGPGLAGTVVADDTFATNDLSGYTVAYQATWNSPGSVSLPTGAGVAGYIEAAGTMNGVTLSQVGLYAVKVEAFNGDIVVLMGIEDNVAGSIVIGSFLLAENQITTSGGSPNIATDSGSGAPSTAAVIEYSGDLSLAAMAISSLTPPYWLGVILTPTTAYSCIWTEDPRTNVPTFSVQCPAPNSQNGNTVIVEPITSISYQSGNNEVQVSTGSTTTTITISEMLLTEAPSAGAGPPPTVLDVSASYPFGNAPLNAAGALRGAVKFRS